MTDRQHARREDEHDGDHQQRARARRAARPQRVPRAQLVGDARADLHRVWHRVYKLTPLTWRLRFVSCMDGTYLGVMPSTITWLPITNIRATPHVALQSGFP